jgi:ParB family chromosome partitioning protein
MTMTPPTQTTAEGVTIADPGHIDRANTSPAAGTIEYIDPASLIIGANVRLAPEFDKSDKSFIDSIRENGVLEPVVARRDEHGNTLIRMGQRRTLAAREAGLSSIPVYVVTGDENTATRIIEQMAENDHRRSLTDGERSAAFQQLAFEGLSVAAIAKRTATKPATVKTGLAVAENALASSAIATHDLTLEQAAALIDFAGDDKTVTALIKVATNDPEQFAHAAQRARDDAARAALLADATAPLIDTGFTILDRAPQGWDSSETRKSIDDYTDKDGNSITEATIAGIDSRAAYLSVTYTGQVRTSFYVTDPKAHGFKKTGPDGSSAGTMTDEQKAERKTLIENNKAWASAQVVRREFLATLLNRKTQPKDAAQFVAHALTTRRQSVAAAATNGNKLANELLGLEHGGYWGPDALAALVEANPTKAATVTLAVAIGALDSDTSKDTWRRPSSTQADYFNRLAAWGYTLSDVEQIVASYVAPVRETATTDSSSIAAENENENEDEGDDGED